MSHEQKTKRINRNKQLRKKKLDVYSRADKCKAFRRKYGVTLTEYELQWSRQNRCCAICDRCPKVNERAFAVDHCHRTGQVRGILCPQCNVDLGRIEKYLSNPARIDQYLSLPPWQEAQSSLVETQLEHREVAEACKAIFTAQFPTIAEAAFA